MNRASTTHVRFDDKSLQVTAEIEQDILALKVIPISNVVSTESIVLGHPFRDSCNTERLEIVIESLLSHDYLLTKRLFKPSELTFKFDVTSEVKTNRLELINSIDQLSSVSTDSSKKALPWLLPRASTSDLYPFQLEGVNWLLSKPKRLLADDMGLGKTVQTIFAARDGFSENLFKKVLVLCPKSLMLNWLAEFRKWSPELLVIAVSPPSKSKDVVFNNAIQNSHIIISSYEQVRDGQSALSNYHFDLVVADEAHRLRKASSQISKGFKRIKRDRFWALTGTPIERDLKDLATLMSLLDDKRFSVADANSATAALREEAKPYILRRTKSSVLKDLPQVISNVEKILLLEEQLKTYRRVLSGEKINGDKIKSPLAKLGELRRVCDYDPISRSSAKLDRIHEELIKIKLVGEKAIVFSYVLEPLEALSALTQKDIKVLTIDGSLSGDERNSVIEKFKNDTSVTALYASSKVASEGLTLVEANHVFFINRWWNPSSNNQARDRVNRIGQKKTVFMHEYICDDTIEENIDQILRSKNRLYDDVTGRLETDLLNNPDIKSHFK